LRVRTSHQRCPAQLLGKAGRYVHSPRRGQPGDHVRIAVDDDGGPWAEAGSSLDCGRGLVIVAGLAADWGIAARPDRAGRTVWALFDWPASN
jgi:hypothetical protein